MNPNVFPSHKLFHSGTLLSHHQPRTPPGFALSEELVKIVVHHFGKDSVEALQSAHTAWRRIESQDIAAPDLLFNFFVEPEEWVSAVSDAWTVRFIRNLLPPRARELFRGLWHMCRNQ